MKRPKLILTIAALAGLPGSLAAQATANTYAACRQATPDVYATHSVSAFMQIPGLGDDFKLRAGGSLVTRPDGTARLTALLGRHNQQDRLFYLELELTGHIASGEPGYPPANTLLPDLDPSAYMPAGPVDLNSFSFYTGGTGVLRGIGAYRGAQVDLQLSQPCQVGIGANNRNVLNGLASLWSANIVSNSYFNNVTITGDIAVRTSCLDENQQYAVHADREDDLSQTEERFAVELPGLLDDYCFIPVGNWTEHANGTATLAGELAQTTNFDNGWTFTLTASDRVDPNDPNYPPTEGPVLSMLPSAYAANGGTVRPEQFRYYRTVTAQLTGLGIHQHSVIDLTGTRPLQVGLGANNANFNLGCYGEFTAFLSSQGPGPQVSLQGSARVRGNFGIQALLPLPKQTPGMHLVLDNVTDQFAMITGDDLAWVEQFYFDGRSVTAGERKWSQGRIRVLDNHNIEFYPPQGLAPGTYTTRVFNRSMAGDFRQLTLEIPATPIIRTPPDRLSGEPMDWFISVGENIQGPALGIVGLSFSNLPSIVPGTVSLDLGNGFTDLLTTGFLPVDPITKVAHLHFPTFPSMITTFRWYCQGAIVHPVHTPLPVPVTDLWYTDFFH
ncbi:MAG: hypothetical protein VYE77_04110 [Planctomycetota bacterium]|nr:hypothetical protein [Planctomycetota bacterium]